MKSAAVPDTQGAPVAFGSEALQTSPDYCEVVLHAVTRSVRYPFGQRPASGQPGHPRA